MASGQRAGGPAVAGSGPRSTAIEDAGTQASMQPWIEMECYQLGRGRQLAQMDVLDLGSHQIVREHQVAAVQKLGVTPPNLCTLSYCTPDSTFRFSELGGSAADTVFFMPERTEFDIYAPAGVQTTYVSFDQEQFLSGARALDPAQWERTPQQLQQIRTVQRAALKGVINRWFDTTGALSAQHAQADAGLMRRLLLHNILQVATAATPDDSLPTPLERSRALQLCRRARAFVEDSLAIDVVPTVVDICAAIGASERSLQYAFRAYVDLSPLAYLRLRRLNRAQAVLRAACPRTATVTAVAMRFGFLHLGRFALDYKEVFGESPSATLAS